MSAYKPRKLFRQLSRKPKDLAKGFAMLDKQRPWGRPFSNLFVEEDVRYDPSIMDCVEQVDGEVKVIYWYGNSILAWHFTQEEWDNG